MELTGTLRRFQSLLCSLNDVPLEEDVERYVCTAEEARLLSGDEVRRGEVLLVGEGAEGPEVSLYVDLDALGRIDGTLPATSAQRFESFCLAAEGVSHFVYLAFRARHAHPVTRFELELQGEVDKYAASVMQVGRSRRSLASRVTRHRLFRRCAFIDDHRTEAGRRYRRATALAARYTAHLERLTERGGDGELLTELRRFYRLGREAKARRIRAL